MVSGYPYEQILFLSFSRHATSQTVHVIKEFYSMHGYIIKRAHVFQKIGGVELSINH